MCGFIGRVNNQRSAVAQNVPLATGLRFLGRRGPDSAKHWMSDDGTIELLHARLAIVDTDSRAHQPLTDQERGTTIAFVGEIYNYLELRNELAEYPFKTRSDTEVLLALYALHGLEGLKRLRGMFALAIVDARLKRVYLVRDPIGKKPLFVARWSDGTYFGSSILALASASRTQPAIQSDLLDQFWKLGHVTPGESLLSNCFPVLPGQVVELDWNGEIQTKSSCVPEISSEPAPTDLTEVKAYISHLLAQSICRRLINNPNPVCLLSGGIDSTVIAKHMKLQGAGSAITLGSVIPLHLDEKYARYAAHRLRLPLQVVRMRVRRFVDDIVWALDLQDEPLGIMSFLPLALMVRSAKDYGRVLLTGDGGDEVFLGYGKPEDWTRNAEAVDGQANGDTIIVGSTLPEWLSSWGRNMLSQSLLGHMLTKLDRATAEQGVEARCAFLDWDLLAFARKLRPQQLFFDGQPKALLRGQLDDWPGWFTQRPKIGFIYHLRWAWGLRGFTGLRDLVVREAVDTFEPLLPIELRKSPQQWEGLAIFHNFSAAWKLLAWSRFLERLRSTSDSVLDLEPQCSTVASLAVDSAVS